MAGIGKTALLRHAATSARRLGHEVLHARGSELERDFAWGVTRQLLEPATAHLDPQSRVDLLRRIAAPARHLLDLDAPPEQAGAVGDPYPMLHGLFWLSVRGSLSEYRSCSSLTTPNGRTSSPPMAGAPRESDRRHPHRPGSGGEKRRPGFRARAARPPAFRADGKPPALTTSWKRPALGRGVWPSAVSILLTASEIRIARLAAQGLSNREIAEALFVTRKTVEHHLGRTTTKLSIRSREQLAEALAER